MNKRSMEDVFPLALLTRDCRLLVVGGGQAAAEKIARLVEFSWQIDVLAPEIQPQIEKMYEEGQVKVIREPYANSCLDGYNLVIVATSDDQINERVLQEAQEKKILCCSAASNWRDGDFITMAWIRSRHGIASFSSGGQSCRRTRLVKGSLSRQLQAANTWTAMAFESDACEGLQTGELIEEIRGVHEFMLLCDDRQMEFYGLVSDRNSTVSLLQNILGTKSLYKGKSAFDRMSKTAARSTDILKEAMEHAQSCSWSGPFMHDWYNKALNNPAFYERLLSTL